MHLGLKLRIPPFAIVLDLVWLDVRAMQDLLNHRLGYRFQAGETSFDSMGLDMLVQVFERP